MANSSQKRLVVALLGLAALPFGTDRHWLAAGETPTAKSRRPKAYSLGNQCPLVIAALG